MPIQVQFIDGVRTLTDVSARQWLRSDGRVIPANLDPALPAMLQKTKVYGFLQHSDFLRDLALVRDFGMWHGDHPPNALSVVDEHLMINVQRVPEWILLRHDRNVSAEVGGKRNPDHPSYVTFIYNVQGYMVFVVWPVQFMKSPPKPNRLGWLPQMEFAAQPGLTDPRPDVSHSFSYTAMDGTTVHLKFP